MFLPFPKVSPKNIYYCGHKLGDTNIASMVCNEVSHDFQ